MKPIVAILITLSLCAFAYPNKEQAPCKQADYEKIVASLANPADIQGSEWLYEIRSVMRQNPVCDVVFKEGYRLTLGENHYLIAPGNPTHLMKLP